MGRILSLIAGLADRGGEQGKGCSSRIGLERRHNLASFFSRQTSERKWLELGGMGQEEKTQIWPLPFCKDNPKALSQ